MPLALIFSMPATATARPRTARARSAAPRPRGRRRKLPASWHPAKAVKIPARPPADPARAAAAVDLKYVSNESPGICRKRAGAGFTFVNARGKPVRDEATLRRIKSLVIPPAWSEVWISPDPAGHLQATGLDARHRKQYRYHPRFREVREQTKYTRMLDFAEALPKIRRRVNRDLKLPGLPREKVLAAVVKLLETTLIRVGNDEYAKSNQSFGLTTLRDKHARITGSRIRFEFKGKSGVEHDIDLSDPRLAKIVKQCQDLPGQELLQYVDEKGDVRDIGSADVNQYIHAIAGDEFTAKDFRTWAGTVLATIALQELQQFDSQAQAKKNIVRAVESVAEKLGNTKAVCRKCYIHPAVIDSYLDGSLIRTLQKRAQSKLTKEIKSLKPEEAMVLTLLQQRLRRDAGRAA
jgi:DNA topoisomerase-1